MSAEPEPTTAVPDPLSAPWSGTKKLAAAGGVLLVLGIVLLAVAGTQLGEHYALRADPAGGSWVLATGVSPARGDVAVTAGGAQQVLGVAGDRLTAPPLLVDGHHVALGGKPGLDVRVPAGSVYLATAGTVPVDRLAGVVVATLEGGDYTATPGSTAFTAAGLPGAPTTDAPLVRYFWLGVAGAAVGLIAVLVLATAALALLVRKLSARMDALAADDEESEPAGEPEP